LIIVYSLLVAGCSLRITGLLGFVFNVHCVLLVSAFFNHQSSIINQKSTILLRCSSSSSLQGFGFSGSQHFDIHIHCRLFQFFNGMLVRFNSRSHSS